MAAPILRLFDSLGAEVVATIALGEATPGVPTTEVVFTVRNNDGGGSPVDPATGVYFFGTARVAGSGTAFLSQGNAFADASALQVRVRAFSGGATGTTTGFRGAPLLLGTIPDGGSVEIGVRVVATAASATSDWELAFSLQTSPLIALRDRLFEAAGNFVYDGRPGGLPDPAFNAVYTRTGALAPDAPADDSVDVWSEVVYAHAGVWLTYTGTEEVFTDVDGDAANLASGEAYYAGLSLGAAGTLTITKGSKATTPLDDDDKPTLPAGEIPAGWVLVPFGLVIDTVEDVLALGFWGFTVTSGLSVEVTAGSGAVGGTFAEDFAPTEFTLADDSTLRIWHLPGTGLEVTTQAADPSDLQSMALWDITTASGAVTVQTDLRIIGDGKVSKLTAPDTGFYGVGPFAPATPPEAPFHLLGGGTPFVPFATTLAVFQNDTDANANVFFSLVAGSNGNCQFTFGDSGNQFNGRILYDNSLDRMSFRVNVTERMRITSSGDVGINAPGGDPTERLEVGGNVLASGDISAVGALRANGVKFWGVLSSDPTAEGVGDYYYNSTANEYRYWNNSTWVAY